MGDKVTPQEEAKFVTTLMDTDFLRNRHWTNEDRLDYLRIVGDYADEVGEKIYRTEYLSEGPTTIGNEIKTKIGEDRPENDVFDIDIGSLLQSALPNATILELKPDEDLSLLESIFEAVRPKDTKGLNPIQFIRAGKCLMGEDAKEWLYSRKYPHEYTHIHVYPQDLCLLLPEDEDHDTSLDSPAWIEPDGVKMEGDLLTIAQAMFHEYIEREGAK